MTDDLIQAREGLRQVEKLVEARLQAHFAAEWVSRVGRFVAEPQPDYSQIALRYDDALGGFKTLAMQTAGGDEFWVVLQLAPLEVAVWQAKRKKSNIPLDTVTHVELGVWLENELKQVGLAGEAIHADIPYSLEHPRLSSGGAYVVNDGNLNEFQTLRAWFANAHSAFTAELANWQGVKPGASPVLCWPHHFDIATLITLDEGHAEKTKEARSIGIGMSPGDDTYSAPYFYINPWPRNTAKELPTPPSGAFWHTDGFFSLIIHAENIKDRQALAQFIKDGTAQAAEHIGYK